MQITAEAPVTGDLQIVGLDGAVTTRHVASASCGEVADALALVGALSFEPLALTSDRHVEPDGDAASVDPVETKDATPNQPAASPSPEVGQVPEQSDRDRNRWRAAIGGRRSDWSDGFADLL